MLSVILFVLDKLFYVFIGVSIRLNEKQVTEIKQRMVTTTSVVGAVTVKELAKDLNVAESTIKNNINELRQVLGEVKKNL